MTTDGRRAYVANHKSDDVSVIDTATKAVVATVAVGTEPVGVAVSPNGAHAVVANAGAGSTTVSVIDTTTNTVTADIAVEDRPFAVALTPH